MMVFVRLMEKLEGKQMCINIFAHMDNIDFAENKQQVIQNYSYSSKKTKTFLLNIPQLYREIIC